MKKQDTKFCKHCLESKSVFMFDVQKGKCISNICKTCRSKYNKAYSQRRKDQDNGLV